MNCDGIGANQNVPVFSVKFKSIAVGNSVVHISATDCVDSNAQEINFQASADCQITVDGKSNVEDNDVKFDDKTTEPDDAMRKSYYNNNEDNQKSGKATKFFSFAKDNTDEIIGYQLLVLALVLVIFLLLFVIYIILKNKTKKSKNSDLEKG